MTNVSEVQVQREQRDSPQASDAKPVRSRKLQRFALALAIGAVIAAVTVAVAPGIISRSGEVTANVSHVGDHANMVHMGHLLLTEWDVSGLNSGLANEVKLGDSVLEVHNDGQTVHRLAIWRGGVVKGDQVVGGSLVAETSFITPGEMVTLDVDLDPGEYVFVCSVRGHLERGMYGTVQLQ